MVPSSITTAGQTHRATCTEFLRKLVMARVYVILNITNGKHSEAVQILQTNPVVQWVDMLEGQWDIIMIIEASDRTRLAKHVVQALASVETITENLEILPARDGSSVKSKFKSHGEAKICLQERE